MDYHTLISSTDSELPAWKRISSAIERAVARGEIPIGTRLPSERTLARQLDKSRTTVVSAYDDLQMKGIIRRYVGRGSYIAGGLDASNAPFAWSGKMARGAMTVTSQAMPHFDTATPALFPIDGPLRRAALEPAPLEGDRNLREAIADLVQCDPGEVLITSGVQQSLDLLARYLVDPKDSVIVEQPGHTGAFHAFRAARAQIAGWNAPAWDLAELQHLIVRHRPKLIYTNPTFQNPTGATMRIETRKELLEIASLHAVPVIEDDTYSLLHWNRLPPPSLRSLDTRGIVIRVGSFSMILGPGVRLGYIIAPAQIMRDLATLKKVSAGSSDAITQHAVGEMLRGGVIEHHLAALRREHKQHYDALARTLANNPAIKHTAPYGGIYAWLKFPHETTHISQRGVAPGANFYPGPRVSAHVRVCFARDIDAIAQLALSAPAIAPHIAAARSYR
jgi:DNA-binding transcriptional MocR family regulator